MWGKQQVVNKTPRRSSVNAIFKEKATLFTTAKEAWKTGRRSKRLEGGEGKGN